MGWWAGRVGGEVGFVGRERELSGLRAALGGDARLLLVVGDAGVGKTRFAEEGMRLASADGMVSLWGTCLPLAEKLPLLPVAEALGELARLDGGRLLDGALEVAPPYVRVEMARLLPQVGDARTIADGGGALRGRLFTAVAELLRAVARGFPLCVVIEDVHWADSATLDFLTFLVRSGHGVCVTVVVTCRGDEPLDSQVADWLAYARGGAGMQEIRLGPLSRDEVAEQAGTLMGGRPAARLADELYARGGGNPFFTEQLVAAWVSGPAGGGGGAQAGLPARLAELLVGRISRCGAAARALLDGLAVAGRPLTEPLLCEVSGLGPDSVRQALRELAAVRLLADSMEGGTHQPRHALLSEAVAASLLPGERAALHACTASAFEGTGDDTLAAEVAGHWAAAGRADKELPARLAAAAAAEQVYGYAEAAAHWQRAIQLYPRVPEASQVGIDVPRLYLRVMRAVETSGDSERAGEIAEEAYRRFASHPDPATAAVIHQWAGFFRGIRTPAAGLPLIKEALRLFEQVPPSVDQAEAWLIYGNVFLLHAEGRQEAGLVALNRALEIAESADTTALTSQILSVLALHTCVCGEVQEGFALLRRGRALAEASGDSETALWQACHETSCLNLMAEFGKASEAALAGLRDARNTGRQTSNDAAVLASSACDAMLARGYTADAAALIDPLITGPPDLDNWPVHLSRAEIDLLRGDIAASGERQQQITALIRHISSIIIACETAQRAAELALWAGRPSDALAQVQRVLGLFTAPHLTVFCGRLLAAGMAACADLAEQARAAAMATGPRWPWVPPANWSPGLTAWPVPRSPTTRSSRQFQRSGPPGTPSGPASAGPATPPPGAQPRKLGRIWATCTGPPTPGGGTPKRS